MIMFFGMAGIGAKVKWRGLSGMELFFTLTELLLIFELLSPIIRDILKFYLIDLFA
jgi:hypothetical protein